MRSIWTKTVSPPSFDGLRGDTKTDVLIIGGGMAGVLCAHMLTRAGVACVLAEANELGGGITKNTTAKITREHGLCYDKMIRRFGIEAAKKYFEAQCLACDAYRELCASLSCDYEEQSAFVYSRTDRRSIEREYAAMKALGADVRMRDTLPLPFSVAGALETAGEAQFHPLKFLYAIAEDLPVFEHTKVRELTPEGALTDGGRITAQKTVVATHFPFLNKHGLYFLKLFQERSYVIALENAACPDGMYVDGGGSGLSFRGYQGLLLLGGGAHRTGTKGDGWRTVEAFAQEHYPHARTVARFATQDCMTLDGIPYIGKYARGTENLYVATGFNKWGMSNAMVSAMLLRDLITGKKNAYADVFSPQRSMLRPALAANAAHSLIGLLTPTVPRCPHMGCALKYNPEEHSWDCPCHGSRFAEDGSLIDNPATDDKRFS